MMKRILGNLMLIVSLLASGTALNARTAGAMAGQRRTPVRTVSRPAQTAVTAARAERKATKAAKKSAAKAKTAAKKASSKWDDRLLADLKSIKKAKKTEKDAIMMSIVTTADTEIKAGRFDKSSNVSSLLAKIADQFASKKNKGAFKSATVSKGKALAKTSETAVKKFGPQYKESSKKVDKAVKSIKKAAAKIK